MPTWTIYWDKGYSVDAPSAHEASVLLFFIRMAPVPALMLNGIIHFPQQVSAHAAR